MYREDEESIAAANGIKKAFPPKGMSRKAPALTCEEIRQRLADNGIVEGMGFEGRRRAKNVIFQNERIDP